MHKQYIGITGFAAQREVLGLLPLIARADVARRSVMIGALASLKTLTGERTRHGDLYPPIERIGYVFADHPNAFNLIHYSTDDQPGLSVQLTRLAQLGGPYLHGVQLNIAWPDREHLALFRQRHPDLKIVLQIGSRAFDIVERSPEKLAAKVAEYDGLVDHALLDGSGGRGVPLDAITLLPHLEALAPLAERGLGLGVAGGLAPDNVRTVMEPLVREFPALSFDAENRLRLPAAKRLHDGYVRRYLREAIVACGRGVS